jgi:oxalate decarboxylase/phosphoglucose isomerase-like protein (cupin superfamily)
MLPIQEKIMTTETATRQVISPRETETIVSSWVTAKIMASPDVSGAEQMSAVSLFFDPGQGHARHNHPVSEQLIFVIGGEGEMMIEDDAGRPVKTALGPGSLVTIPRGAFHSTFNTGWEPLRILAVYSPAGPEQAMRSSDEFTVLAPGVMPSRA